MTDPEALWVTGASCGLLIGIFIGCIGGEWWNAKASREVEGEKLDKHAPQGMEIRLCGLWLHQNGVTERFCCGDPECSTCYPMTRDQANEINQRFLQWRGYGALEQDKDKALEIKVKP